MRLAKFRCILMASLLVLVLLHPLTSDAVSSGVNSVDSHAPLLTYKKDELIETKYSPSGELLSEVVMVKFEVYNNGPSPVHVCIRDRAECIDADTLTMLYGTPKPEMLEEFGNTTLITWDNVKIEAGSNIEYRYMAETWRMVPIDINETVYLNGNRSDLKKIGKIYTLNANVSDTLTFEVAIRNVGQPLYTGRKKVIPPILCTVTVMLSNDYFSDIVTHPEANSTSTIASASVTTWVMLLNDSVNLSLSARIKDVSSWGEAPIEPIIIRLEPVPETMITEIEQREESLNDSIKALSDYAEMLDELSRYIDQMAGAMSGMVKTLRQIGASLRGASDALNNALTYIDQTNPAHGIIVGVRDQLSALADQLSSSSSGGSEQVRSLAMEMRSMVGGLKGQIEDLKRKRDDLEDLLLVIQNQKIPPNVEVHSAAIQHSCEARPCVEKVRGTNKWKIKSIDITNVGNNTDVVHGISVQLMCNQTSLKPEYALVLVNGEWQEFDGDLRELGLAYDSVSGTLYLWPRVAVNSSDSSNALVDWSGRPIQIVIECECEPEVRCAIDVEERDLSAHVEPTRSQMACSINQPHVLAWNLTFPHYTPQPPQQSGGRFQITTEHLWLIEGLLFGVVLLVSFLLLKRRGYEAKPMEGPLMAEGEVKIEGLLKEIEDLRRVLESSK